MRPIRPPPAQVFQGIHGEERIRILNDMGGPPLHQIRPGRSGLNLLPQLEDHDSDAKGTAFGIKDRYLQVLPLLRLKANQIIGTG